MSNNASSNSIRPSRPTIRNFSNNKQDKPPIFIHSDNINKNQSNKWNKESNEDDDGYKRKEQDEKYHEMNIRRNSSNSKYEADSRSEHSHYHPPKHYHSYHNSPSSYHSSHSSHSSHFSKSHKSHSRSRSNNHRDRYHSRSTHSHSHHHSSSQIIIQDEYKQKSSKSHYNNHKYKSPSHSSSSFSSSSSSSQSQSPKRIIEQQLKPPELNKNIEHNPNTPRDSKLTNILSSSLPLPSPPHSPIIIPTLETANRNEPPSVIQSIHEIVENMRSNKSVEKALSNCGIENGMIIKSQNHYKNIKTIDDNPYFGFSKINNLQYYIDNKNESYLYYYNYYFVVIIKT